MLKVNWNSNFKFFSNNFKNQILGNDLSTGTVKYEFIGSGPPQDTGLHRYVFIAFKQTEKMEFEDLPFVTNR